MNIMSVLAPLRTTAALFFADGTYLNDAIANYDDSPPPLVTPADCCTAILWKRCIVTQSLET